jgi:acyl carrier protein
MRHSICTRIREHIVDAWLNGDARGFDDDADLQRTGILDSFTTLSLASFLDETFHIQVDPIDINTESFRTVNSVADLVLDKLAAKQVAASAR